MLAGHIVSLGADDKLQHVAWIGYVVVGTTIVTAVLAWFIQQDIQKRALSTPEAAALKSRTSAF